MSRTISIEKALLVIPVGIDLIDVTGIADAQRKFLVSSTPPTRRPVETAIGIPDDVNTAAVILLEEIRSCVGRCLEYRLSEEFRSKGFQVFVLKARMELLSIELSLAQTGRRLPENDRPVPEFVDPTTLSSATPGASLSAPAQTPAATK